MMAGWDISRWLSLEWVLHTSITVSLLIGLILLIRRPFAKTFGAGAAYALWLLPIIRLFMPGITIPRIFPEIATQSSQVEPALPLSDINFLVPNFMETSAKTPWIEQALPIALGLWIMGAIGFFIYHWLRQAAYMDKLLYNSEPAYGLEAIIKSAAKTAGLDSMPKVKVSDNNDGPMVTGLLRPIIILPANFATSFSPKQQRYALLHEFMHIKRGDLFMATGWLIFRSLNWPNLLVHYAAKHFRSDQEAACDASVLSVMGDSKDSVSAYAETLIHAAKAALTDGRASPQSGALALTIHHPLKERLMILGTHKKISNWHSRIAAAVMIIGAATLSAPLTQADAHPEEELAGNYSQHQGKSVIKRKVKVNGEMTSEHFEINVDGDDVTAYKIDPSGKKTRIDVKDIEGVAVSSNEGDLADWVSNSGSALVFRSDTLEGLEGLAGLKALDRLEGLKGLEGLEKLEALKSLKSLKNLETLNGFETFTFLSDGEDNLKLKMRLTESKLAAARAMLEDTEVDADDSREMVKAKRELEKARKALKAAERALKDAK